jgi:superfamily I DNA/RNA helicase
LEWDSVCVDVESFLGLGDEEVRKLFYVACTRAKKSLSLSGIEKHELERFLGGESLKSIRNPKKGED